MKIIIIRPGSNSRRRAGDKPLPERVMTRFIDACMCFLGLVCWHNLLRWSKINIFVRSNRTHRPENNALWYFLLIYAFYWIVIDKRVISMRAWSVRTEAKTNTSGVAPWLQQNNWLIRQLTRKQAVNSVLMFSSTRLRGTYWYGYEKWVNILKFITVHSVDKEIIVLMLTIMISPYEIDKKRHSDCSKLDDDVGTWLQWTYLSDVVYQFL